MIVSVVYPHHEGSRFDRDYYVDHHTPLVEQVWRPLTVTLVAGTAAADGGAAPYAMIGHFHFADEEAFAAAMAHPRMAELVADVANFTDIAPVLSIGELVQRG